MSNNTYFTDHNSSLEWCFGFVCDNPPLTLAQPDWATISSATGWTAESLNLPLEFVSSTNLYPYADLHFFFKPYGFHQVMKSLFVPLRLATDARGLEFVTELDPNIDEVRPVPSNILRTTSWHTSRLPGVQPTRPWENVQRPSTNISLPILRLKVLYSAMSHV